MGAALFHHVTAWLGAGTTIALLHRYFLSIANGLPDLDPDASYAKRVAFNIVQGIAGNEHRVNVARDPLPNSIAPDPGQKE